MKAIVLTCDRYRAITEHMILQYERLWPDHPFVFRIPYQKLAGVETPRTTFVQTPAGIRATVLQLIADLDDEEWIYWSIDDKYPVQLVTEKIADFISNALGSLEMSGLLFCRRGPTLENPELTLYPHKHVNPGGDVYLERRSWFQIWLHQLLKVKVLRHLFTRLPDHLPSPKAMDLLKDKITKPPEYRLFVTEKNFAVFGESTNKGTITQNCYESIVKTDINLPKWFRRPNRFYVTMGEL
jgi:hypothetical protein